MREINTNTSYGGNGGRSLKPQEFDSIKYYTISELSALIHMEEGTIRNRLCRGDPMPPSIRIGRKRLFPSNQFHQWMIDMKV